MGNPDSFAPPRPGDRVCGFKSLVIFDLLLTEGLVAGLHILPSLGHFTAVRLES